MAFALGEMGLRDEDFWELTPYELHRRVVGWNRRERSRRQLVMYGAWHTAAFQRSKRMPSLMRMLTPPKAKKLEGKEREERQRQFEERARRSGVAIYGQSNVV